MNQPLLIPGLDNSPQAQQTRRALGIGPMEWCRLSERDRLDLIECWLKEQVSAFPLMRPKP